MRSSLNLHEMHTSIQLQSCPIEKDKTICQMSIRTQLVNAKGTWTSYTFQRTSQWVTGTDGILLIRSDEQEVANMREVLVSHVCSGGWEVSPVKI